MCTQEGNWFDTVISNETEIWINSMSKRAKQIKQKGRQPGDWMPLWWWEKPVIQPDDGNQLLRKPTAPDPSLSWGQRLKSSNIGKQDRAEERCGGALRIKHRRRLQWRRWMEGGGQGGGSRSEWVELYGTASCGGGGGRPHRSHIRWAEKELALPTIGKKRNTPRPKNKRVKWKKAEEKTNGGGDVGRRDRGKRKAGEVTLGLGGLGTEYYSGKHMNFHDKSWGRCFLY